MTAITYITTEKLERIAVSGHPGALVHAKGRANEHVPAHGQHHHEAPHPLPAPKLRIEPPTQVAVVDLGLLAGRDVGPQHRHLVLHGLVGKLQPKARDADVEPVLVTQALVHRGGFVRLEHLFDAFSVGIDHRVGLAAGTRVGELREPAPDEGGPLVPRQRRATRSQAGRHGRRHVLSDGLSVRPQALGHDRDGPSTMPVDEDLHDVDHVKRSPCHVLLVRLGGRTKRLVGQGARWGDPHLEVGNYVNVEVGNYLNGLHIYWGIT